MSGSTEAMKCSWKLCFFDASSWKSGDIYVDIPSGKLTVGPWKSPVFIEETSLPTPMTARVYVNLPEGIWYIYMAFDGFVFYELDDWGCESGDILWIYIYNITQYRDIMWDNPQQLYHQGWWLIPYYLNRLGINIQLSQCDILVHCLLLMAI